MPHLEGAREQLDERRDLALVLLDRHLGEHSGLELLDWMAARNLRVPVLVHSWSNEVDMVEEAYDRGAAGFLPKPQGLEPLKAMVRGLKGYWIDLNLTP